MIKLKGKRTALRGILSVAALLLLVTGLTPLLPAGEARAQGGEQAKAWKNITMIYTTDIKGKIDPCG